MVFFAGLILLLLGIFIPVHILFVIGVIMLIVGAALWAAAELGHPIGGRRW
jgi:membrane protein implicated in regulation of membrane protease activity